jgi:predicted PhzF superfamily epimerase YddE/YHI9
MALKPNFDALNKLDLRGVVVTAEGKEVDFVSRFFAPRYGINEDPVTGSAHCSLTPYWADKLNKTILSARQVSERTGYIECELKGNRVLLSGKAVKYMEGKINF